MKIGNEVEGKERGRNIVTGKYSKSAKSDEKPADAKKADATGKADSKKPDAKKPAEKAADAKPSVVKK